MFEASIKLNRGIQNFHWESGGGDERVKEMPWETLKSHKAEARIKRAKEIENQERSEAAYKFGFEDGRDIGRQEGKEEAREAVDRMNKITRAFDEQRAQLLKKADEVIVGLALKIAEIIIHQELQTDPGIVTKLAKESLKLVEDKKRLCIKVNPSDWKILKESEAELPSLTHGVKEMEIKEDEHVEPGGCIVESDSGIVDAQLSTQLEEVAERLFKSV